MYKQLNCSFIQRHTHIYITRVSIIIFGCYAKAWKRVRGDLLHQIQSVLRSPESISRCVVPYLDFQKRSPESRSPNAQFRIRTSWKHVRRQSTYVDIVRTLIEHVHQEHVRQGNTYVGGRRTSVEDVRASSKYVVTICVRHQITYARKIRTSTNHVHQYNVAESRSSPEYVREENAYVTENTYVSGRRTSAEYVRTSQYLRICTHGCRYPRMHTPNLHYHGCSWNTTSRSEDKRT